jgi:hypothetical protein
MTSSLIAELDEILGFSEWDSLRREARELMVTWFERLGPEPDHWVDFDEPAYALRAVDMDRLNQLIADIENKIRSVHALNYETGKVVPVPDYFWQIRPWVISRGPRGGWIGEVGAEWRVYRPEITITAEPEITAVGKPTRKRGRTPKPDRDPTELVDMLAKIEKGSKHPLKKHDAITALQAQGVKWRQAEKAFAELVKQRAGAGLKPEQK